MEQDVRRPPAVNEERAGDAVEVCLATLYFATLYPVSILGRPVESYAGLDHSLRSFAVSTGCIHTTGSQRPPPGASMSNEVSEMSKAFAKVLAIPAVIITMEEYYAIVKKMRQGPEELARIVKDEPEEDITDISAEPGVVDAAPSDENEPTREEAAIASPQTEEEQNASGEEEAPDTPVSAKKRRIGTTLEELLTQADNLKVCPVCWSQRLVDACPRAPQRARRYIQLCAICCYACGTSLRTCCGFRTSGQRWRDGCRRNGR